MTARLLVEADADHPRITHANVEVDATEFTGYRFETENGPIVVLGASEQIQSDHAANLIKNNAYPVLNAEALRVAAAVAEQYFVNLAEVLPLMLPPHLKRLRKKAHMVETTGTLPPVSLAELNSAQATVVEAIESSNSEKEPEHILWGVTGSGKTRIYEHLIDATLKRGEQVLLLLPEIALSGQLMEIMTTRFPNRTVLYHSGLAEGERSRSHAAFLSGAAPIAIGTRSAILLPAKNLGLIIIDEEHDASYKDMRQIRFDTRTVARLRQRVSANRHTLRLVLGSATPTLDTLARARSGEAKLHRLRERATGQSLPTVHIPEYLIQTGLIGPFLRTKMLEHLEAKNQVLLLMNRRGHSTHVHCPTCGTYAECPRCSVALTYHKDNELRCHQCGYQEHYARACPKDGTARQLSGRGIQRVEEILDGQFSAYSYARLDRDTARKRGFAEDVMQTMRAGGIDILIGTQMIAKGFDIAGVTLVGVLAIDQMLTAPDFRASENAWQLLSQVVGRSGRHKPGEVVIQTMSPAHPVIQSVQAHDADAFYHYEADVRRKTKYPPFANLARIVMAADDEQNLHRAAERLAKDIQPSNTEQLFSASAAETTVELLGPALPAVGKIENTFRVHFLIKATSVAHLREYAERILPVLQHYRKTSKIQIVLDLEPREVA